MTTAARPFEALPSAEHDCNRLQEMIDGLPVGIYRSTPGGRIVAANAAMLRLLGYPSQADLLVVKAEDLYADPEERERWMASMEREGVVQGFEFRVRRAGGEAIWVRDTARAVRDDDGRILYYEGVLEDINEHKRIRDALRESERTSQSLFENAPIGVAIVAPDGRFMQVNRAFCEMLEYRPDELTALGTYDVTHPEDAERARAESEWRLRTATLFEVDRRYVRKSGTVFWAHITAQIIRDEAGHPLYAVAMIEDADERRRAEDALHEANAKLSRSLAELQHRTTRMARLTETTDLLQSCRTLEEAYGILQTRLPNLFVARVGAVYVHSNSRKLLEAVAAWGLREGDLVFEPDDCWAMRRGRHHVATESGPYCPHFESVRPAWSMCVPMAAQGETLGILSVGQTPGWGAGGANDDVDGAGESERLFAATVAEHIALALANLRLRESLKSQSIRDPLTGLFNRRYMEETLERELRRADRRKSPVCAVMFDIDHFKQFNDTNGHLAGDALLRALGEFLQANFRGEDIVCRYGGEEFVLILPEAALEPAVRRVETLRERVKMLHVPYRGTLLGGVTISLGVAAFPTHGSTVDALLRAADGALYQAKTAGRDRVVTAGDTA